MQNMSEKLYNELNKNIEILICEDDEENADIERKLISTFSEQYNFDFIKTTVFNNTFDLVEYLKTQKNNKDHEIILILDIVINDDISIDVINNNQELFNPYQIMFITSSVEYKRKIYNARHNFFLEKSDLLSHFNEGLLVLLENVFKESSKIITLTFKNKQTKINTSKIKYIQSNKHNIEITLSDSDEILIFNMKLDEMEEMLDDNFIRCHKSYVVNYIYIKTFSANLFIMDNGIEFSITQTYKKAVMNKLALLNSR